MNLKQLDHNLTCWLHEQSGKKPWLDKLAIFTARDLPFVFVLLPVVVILAKEYHNPTSPGIFAVFFLGLLTVAWLLTQLLAYGLQIAFRRKRPFQSEHLHPIYQARIPSPSFPSGHATMVSFVLTLHGIFAFGSFPLLSLWPFVGMAIMGVMILVARVYGGLHYVSDILAGLLFGSGMVFFFLWLANALANLAEPMKVL